MKLYGVVNGATKLLSTLTTSSSGSYDFSNLATGSYYVYVTNQTSKYKPTGKSASYYQLKLTSGTALVNNNFGEKPL